MAYWNCLHAYEIRNEDFYPEKFEPAFLASCDDLPNKQIRSFQYLIDS